MAFLNDRVLNVLTYVAEQFDSKLQLQAVYLVWTGSDVFGQAFEHVDIVFCDFVHTQRALDCRDRNNRDRRSTRTCRCWGYWPDNGGALAPSGRH